MTKSKVISIALIAIFAFMMLSQVAFASNVTTGQDIAIINIAQIIGMGVAIIMLIVLAIQYIAAAPEGKAEIKKNSTIYIVGAIILFSAAALLQIIKNFAIQNIGSTGNTAF